MAELASGETERCSFCTQLLIVQNMNVCHLYCLSSVLKGTTDLQSLPCVPVMFSIRTEVLL
jgi:hypothetical protein